MDTSTRLIPLTRQDDALGEFQFTASYVIDAKPGELDVEKLKRATARVVDKWRMLSGRIVFSEELKRHAVRVPVGPIPDGYKTLDFTTAEMDASSPFVNTPALSSSVAVRLPYPSMAVLAPPSPPKTIRDFLKRDLPIVKLHVAQYVDVAIVSLSVPHCVLDGSGVGLVLSSIDAELKGEECQVPPMHEVNPFEQSLKRISATQFTEEEKAKAPPMPGWTGMAVGDLARLIFGDTLERLVHGNIEGCIFVGREVVEEMLRDIKEEVKETTRGKEFVSENDIFANWAFQAVYRYDPSPPTHFLTSNIVSVREVCSTPEVSLKLYPFNCLLTYPLHLTTPLPIADFLSTPLADLALSSRRTLELYRTEASVNAFEEWMDANYPFLPGASFSFANLWGGGKKVVNSVWSSQTSANLLGLDFPSTTGKKLAIRAFLEPGNPSPDLITHNKLGKEGYFFNGKMRKVRWDSFERTVKEMEARLAEKKVTA